MLISFLLRPIALLILIFGFIVGVVVMGDGEPGRGWAIIGACIVFAAYLRYKSQHTVRVRD
jgi:hypothetical protein